MEGGDDLRTSIKESVGKRSMNSQGSSLEPEMHRQTGRIRVLESAWGSKRRLPCQC